MKEEDLKTGDIIETTSSDFYMVFKNSCKFPFNEFLINIFTKGYDCLTMNYCIRVFRPTHNCAIGIAMRGKKIPENYYDLIWERNPTHTIQIDGKEIELSEASYQNIKKHFS